MMWTSTHSPVAAPEYTAPASQPDTTMQRIAMHHIYEYEKGVRCMVLCTLSPSDLEVITARLAARGIAYLTKETPSASHVNLFFGRGACIETVAFFLRDRHLHELSPEQDFILGSLLGYDLCGQCERYRTRRLTAVAD